MGTSLFQPSLNTSHPLSAFPPPFPPDFASCDPYYSSPTPPLASDCNIALSLLPLGTEPIPWYAEPAPGREHVLPIKVVHGSCQIIFHTSGPAAKEVDPNYVFPSDVTDMAGLLMGRCVHDGKSGYITKGLKNSIDSMVDPDVGFGEGKHPQSTTFYSLFISNTAWSDNDSWNPGNSEKSVGLKILEKIQAAVRKSPAGSKQKSELMRRARLVRLAVGRLKHGFSYAWWADPSDEVGEQGSTSGMGSVKQI